MGLTRAQRRTAEPLTRPDCGGYPGFFVVRSDFPTGEAEPVLVHSYLFLITCTYLWRLVEGDLWCLVVQNSPESQDFVESPTRGAERPQVARLPAAGGKVGATPARRALRGILEPDVETLRTGGGGGEEDS